VAFCCGPKGRGGGRASALLPLLDDVPASPASRRLASARPALAPKCHLYSLTGPYPIFKDHNDFNISEDLPATQIDYRSPILNFRLKIGNQELGII
jgi:hypothetical protein